jgi:hypothetical protein
MGRGNARFGCPNGTLRVNDHSALHYHVYVDYPVPDQRGFDDFDQDDFDDFNLEIVNHIGAVCAIYSIFEFPEDKRLDRDTLVIAESRTMGVATSYNEGYIAVYVYAKDCDETEEYLNQNVFNLACRLFWEMRHMKLRQRSCAWTSREYQGTPTPT